MAKIDPCAGPASDTIPLDAALTRIQTSLSPLQESERIGLKQARGRVLAEAVTATTDLPPFPNSAMDGYALHSADAVSNASLKVIGTAFAGHPFEGRVDAGECVRIFTGAAIPAGADAVATQEEVRREGDFITLSAPIARHRNIRPSGDEIPAGQCVLAPGKLLTSADLGLIASTGLPELAVIRKLRVVFFSTGDELTPLGEPLAYGRIYDSNRYTLHGLLEHPAIEAVDLGVIRDDPDAIQTALSTVAQDADVILTTGGVSVGEADFVTGILKTLGQIDFWKIAVKPGKPFAFGRIRQAWFFGMPGNPVAVIVTFRQLVRPALLRLLGAHPTPPTRLPAVCRSRLRKSPGRMEFQRGVYTTEDNGLSVISCGPQGSHRLSTVSQANCFIVLPMENAGVEPGDTVIIEPLEEFHL